MRGEGREPGERREEGRSDVEARRSHSLPPPLARLLEANELSGLTGGDLFHLRGQERSNEGEG